MPFAVERQRGVLTLTLDTPGSPVNVLNRATAEQLVEVLSGVGTDGTRAIVFESAKPNSFINGVGLLLAQATRTVADVARAAAAPWAAYRAVREAPVPTIAVVRGNCFGCGVEFALQCDYRLAVDTDETRFYMTELNDYLLIPLFGGTWTLPEAVGVEDSVDLLLWGARWDAARACARGLVDAVVPHAEVAGGRQRFVARVLDGTQPSLRRGRVAWGDAEDDTLARARRRIAALPPAYQPVYADGLRLLEAGARQTTSHVAHQEQALEAAAASALSPLGKAAHAFFYLRQMAAERAAGRPRDPAAPLTVAVDAEVALAGVLRAARLPGLTVSETGAADVHLVAAGVSANGRAPAVAVRVESRRGPLADAELYAPAYRGGCRLVELATRGDRVLDPERAARLTRILQRLGFEVARTTPDDTFVTTRLLTAYLVPLVAYVERGGDVRTVNGVLRAAGFVRRPHDLLAALEAGPLAVELGTVLGRSGESVAPILAALAGEEGFVADPDEPALLDALCIALLDAVRVSRERGEIRDPSIADLIARELLDFPLHRCSLSTWLKTARVARALAADGAVRPLVPAAAYESARAFVAAGREFYR